MIVLDTNIISEPNKRLPAQQVVDWLNSQQAPALFTTTINVAELRFGIERLPYGKKKTVLWAALDFTLGRLCANRILSFDLPAAEELARIDTQCEATGKKIGLADAQIAAVAKVNGFAVATRDATPFELAGVTVIDPWKWPQ